MNRRVPRAREARDEGGLSKEFRFAEAALRLYDLPDATMVPLKEGKNVSLFRVSSRSRGNFLLRSYTLPRLSARAQRGARSAAAGSLFTEEAFRSQAIWLSDLRKNGRLPVPEPVPIADGTFMGTVALDDLPDRRFSLLLRWIPGEQKKITDFTTEDARDLGSYVARLHLHAERFTAPEGFFRPRWDWESLFDESAPYWRLAESVLTREELDALRFSAGRIKEVLDTLGEGPDQFGMIHRDLHPQNVVFHAGVVYAIDFDHCGWGHYMYDLARPHLYFERTGESRERLQGALMEGYEHHRPLPDDPHVVMEAFMNMHRMNYFILALARLRQPRSAEISISPAEKSALLENTIGRLVRVSPNGTD